jgi:hypothetical protein
VCGFGRSNTGESLSAPVNGTFVMRSASLSRAKQWQSESDGCCNIETEEERVVVVVVVVQAWVCGK